MRLPGWFIEHCQKEKLACEKCKAPFDPAWVIFLGIKNVNFNKKAPEREMLYCELICGKCGAKAGYTFFDLKLEAFALAIINEAGKSAEDISGIPPATEESEPSEENAAKPKNKPKSKTKSKISADEEKAVKKMLDSLPFPEFLKQIGASVDDEDSEPKKPDNFKIKNEDDDEQNK